MELTVHGLLFMPEYTPISAAQYRLLDKYTNQELHRLKTKRKRLENAQAIFAREGIAFDQETLNGSFSYIKTEENLAIDLRAKLEGRIS
jgi:hypothetical protein